MLKKLLFSLCIVLSIVSYSFHGNATSLIFKNFNDLIEETEGIIIGTVSEKESLYAHDKDIYTFVTFDQLEILQGQYDQPTLTIRLIGGRIDNEGLCVPGSPEFNKNDRVVVFLKGNGKNLVPFVGWHQGVFRVNTDIVSGKEVLEDYHGNRILSIRGNDVVKEYMKPLKKDTHGYVMHSEIPDESFVVSDENIMSEEESIIQEKKQSEQQPMLLQEFIETVKNRVQKKRKKTDSIKSIKVGDFANSVIEKKVSKPKMHLKMDQDSTHRKSREDIEKEE